MTSRTLNIEEGFSTNSAPWNLGISSVLHINDRAGRFGGTEQYIGSLTEALASQNVTSHLAYGVLTGDAPDGPQLHHVAGLNDRSGKSLDGAGLARLVEELEPDLVYVHNIFSDEVIQIISSQPRDHLVFWYVHDHFLTCLTELRTLRSNSDRLAVCEALLSEDCFASMASGSCVHRSTLRDVDVLDLAARQRLLNALESVDAVVVVSEYMRGTLLMHLPELAESLHVLPRQIAYKLSGVSHRPDDQVVLAFAGRITEEKGLNCAIEAAGLLRLDRPVRFLIAGPIEDASYWNSTRELMDRAVAESPGLQFEYLGHLTPDEMARMYQSAHIAVVPSLWAEPLGVIPAEAVMHGAAVVASDVGGLSTWFPDGCTGLLVRPGDPRDLADAITELMENDMKRQRLVTAGVQHVRCNFNTKLHLEALGKLMEKHVRRESLKARLA